MNLIVSVQMEKLLSRLTSAPAEVRASLFQTVQRLTILLQTKVKQDKLSGQVLHVRSGTLRRSINRLVGEDKSGIFGQVGTNVAYARPHEYGFQGVQKVAEHIRVTKYGNVTVRSHDRRVNLPARSFLRSSLREMQPEIQRDLRAAVIGAFRK